MNICLINPTRRVALGVQEICRDLLARGNRVSVLTPVSPKKWERDNLDAADIKVYPSVFLPGIRYTIPDFVRQYIILRELARQEKIDIIHIWTYIYPSVWIPWLYAKCKGIPVVVSVGSFSGITWSYGSGFVDFMAKIYTKTIGRIILKSCDRVFLWNPDEVKQAVALGIREDRLAVCLSGFRNTDRFTDFVADVPAIRANLGIEPDEAMLLNVGRLTRVKGIDTLIRITRCLLDDGFRVKMVIVGEGPGEAGYKKMVQGYGVQNQVIFTGFREDVPQLMTACDIFVFPSRGEELGGALIEAAMCGRPLVSSDVGGLRHVVIEGETGFTAGPEDVDLFVRHVEALLVDKDMAGEMGRKASAHARDNLGLEKFLTRNSEVYEELIHQN